MGNPTGIERRKFKRLDVALNIVITIETGGRQTGLPEKLPARCSNLSLQGLCLETSRLADGAVKLLSGPAGERDYRLALEIDLPSEDQPLLARGEVCWYNIDHTTLDFSYQVGIRFVELAPAARIALKRFIKNNCRRQGLLATMKSFFTFR